MIYRFLIALLLLSSATAWGQEKPNYDKIEMDISDPFSALFYPTLMERYAQGDTTLTARDYHYLYYGFPFQKGYKPLMDSPYTDSLNFEFGRRTSPNPATYLKIVTYARGAVGDRPFSLRDLNALAFGLKMLGEDSLAVAITHKVKMIESAIKSTGTGLGTSSPWYIIYMNDAEDVLNLMSANYTRSMMVNSKVMFIPVSNLPEIGYTDKKLRGFYFDYSQIYLRKPDYLEGPDKPKRKMEFNPRYNPRSKLNTLPK